MCLLLLRLPLRKLVWLLLRRRLLLLLLLLLGGGEGGDEGGWLQGLLHARAGSRTNVAPFPVQTFLRVPSTSNER